MPCGGREERNGDGFDGEADVALMGDEEEDDDGDGYVC